MTRKDVSTMFFIGISSIGLISHVKINKTKYLSLDTQQAVSNDFFNVGNNIRKAIKDVK